MRQLGQSIEFRSFDTSPHPCWAHDLGRIIFDGFVKNPISALRFIPLSLRRTARTPYSTGFARLELGLFTKPSGMMTFYESLIFACR
jgi:hypothetical protein